MQFWLYYFELELENSQQLVLDVEACKAAAKEVHVRAIDGSQYVLRVPSGPTAVNKSPECAQWIGADQTALDAILARQTPGEQHVCSRLLLASPRARQARPTRPTSTRSSPSSRRACRTPTPTRTATATASLPAMMVLLKLASCEEVGVAGHHPDPFTLNELDEATVWPAQATSQATSSIREQGPAAPAAAPPPAAGARHAPPAPSPEDGPAP